MACFFTTYKVSTNEIIIIMLAVCFLFPAIIELLLYMYIIPLKYVNSVFQSIGLGFDDFTSMTETPIFSEMKCKITFFNSPFFPINLLNFMQKLM